MAISFAPNALKNPSEYAREICDHTNSLDDAILCFISAFDSDLRATPKQWRADTLREIAIRHLGKSAVY